MKKIVALAALLCLSSACFAQVIPVAPIEGKVIINSQTPTHTAIENFEYAIVLPNTGYKQTASNLVTIFRNEADNASITIRQYESNEAAISKLEYGALSTDIYKINGTEAILYKYEKKGELKQILAYFEELNGMTENPIVIEATCDSSNIGCANKIERSLLSIIYTGVKPKASNIYETSAFSIENGGFKNQHTGILNTIFTKSGDYENERRNKEFVYFQLLRNKSSVKKGKQKKDAANTINTAYLPFFLALNANEAAASIDRKINASKPKKTIISGIDGYEFDIDMIGEGGKKLAKGYAVVLYGNDVQYLFFSNANKDIDNNIAKFKQIARTLKIK